MKIQIFLFLLFLLFNFSVEGTIKNKHRYHQERDQNNRLCWVKDKIKLKKDAFNFNAIQFLKENNFNAGVNSANYSKELFLENYFKNIKRFSKNQLSNIKLPESEIKSEWYGIISFLGTIIAFFYLAISLPTLDIFIPIPIFVFIGLILTTMVLAFLGLNQSLKHPKELKYKGFSYLMSFIYFGLFALILGIIISNS